MKIVKTKKCPVCGKNLELINGYWRHRYPLEKVLNGNDICDFIEKGERMAKEKRERNERFKVDWREKGFSNEELAEKYRMTVGGVKALKQRIRKKEREEKEKKGKVVIKVKPSPSTQTQMSTSTMTSPPKRMTFWLEEETINQIKRLSQERGITCSQIARELFKEHLKDYLRIEEE